MTIAEVLRYVEIQKSNSALFPITKQESPQPGLFCCVRDRGIVPLFLIRFAHKNAGRGSTVSISRKKEMKTCFRRSILHERALMARSYPARTKMAHLRALIFVLVRDRGIESYRFCTPFGYFRSLRS